MSGHCGLSRYGPAREHDTTALRTHTEIFPALAAWTGGDRPVLRDLGYEGEAGTSTVAIQEPKAANSPTNKRPTTKPTTGNARSGNEKTR